MDGLRPYFQSPKILIYTNLLKENFTFLVKLSHKIFFKNFLDRNIK